MSGQHKHPGPNQPTSGEQKRNISGSVHVEGKVEVHLPPNIQDHKAAADKKRDTRETIKQWVEGITLFFVILVAGISMLQAHYAKISSDAATTAANAAASQAVTSSTQLELSERPWVSATPAIVSPLYFNVNGVNLAISFHLHNTGLLPAVGAFPYAKFYPAIGPGTNNFREAAKAQISETCKLAENVPKVGDDNLFPLGDSTKQIRINKPAADLTINDPTHDLLIKIAVCVAYRTSFNDKVYSTGQIYILTRTDRKSGHDMTFVPGESVPKESLHLGSDSEAVTLADGNYTIQ